MSTTSIHVRGSRIKAADPGGMKPCDRCGRMTVQQRARKQKRKDGLTMCKDCCLDTWYVKSAGRTVSA